MIGAGQFQPGHRRLVQYKNVGDGIGDSVFSEDCNGANFLGLGIW